MSKTKAWIHAFRLRTLPLALSSILMGSFAADAHDGFNWQVLVLAITTTIFLQILSNLANDYGDAVTGADNEERVGPERAIQSGAITKGEMRKAMVVFVLLSLLSGIALIYFGLQGLSLTYVAGFFALGIAAIAAAIKYTVGKNPYGYSGLGDLFVFLFFGITGVVGTYYLHTHAFSFEILLPASAMGFLSAGVLNLNNMRDRENDAKVGKRTLVVLIGAQSAKVYHTVLIVGALVVTGTYTLLNFHSLYQLLFLITVPLLAMNLKAVLTNQHPRELDPQLKKLALTTLLFSLTFGIGLII